jgi:8-oxo-dGTP diphosphatase
MSRTIRYQGAIVRDHHVLLIKHSEYATGREYWLLPGGGIERDETEEQCVRRELREETGVDVQVERLLLDEPSPLSEAYQWFKTYLCRPIAGEASPGYEPEPEAARVYEIAAVRWVDLRDEATWGDEVVANRVTYPLLCRIQEVLGYRKDVPGVARA